MNIRFLLHQSSLHKPRCDHIINNMICRGHFAPFWRIIFFFFCKLIFFYDINNMSISSQIKIIAMFSHPLIYVKQILFFLLFSLLIIFTFFLISRHIWPKSLRVQLCNSTAKIKMINKLSKQLFNILCKNKNIQTDGNKLSHIINNCWNKLWKFMLKRGRYFINLQEKKEKKMHTNLYCIC